MKSFSVLLIHWTKFHFRTILDNTTKTGWFCVVP